jgi:hypothetical protein
MSRVWPLLAAVLAIVLVAGLWWAYRLQQCEALCGSSRASRALALAGGDTVPVLSTTREGDAVFVDYITTHDPAERVEVCAELEAVLRALVSNGELATAPKVYLIPTYPQTRVLGWTWRGPVTSCCASVGTMPLQTPKGDGTSTEVLATSREVRRSCAISSAKGA